MTPSPYDWFTRFRDALHDQIASGAISHARPCRDALHEVTFGWYTRVAQLESDPRIGFEIWFDRYLDAAGSYNLGCWYEATWTMAKNLIQPLGAAWGIEAPVYKSSDREDD